MNDIKLERLKRIVINNESRKSEILKAKCYYENQTDIQECGVTPKNYDGNEGKDPLRSADNRLSHNFHQILVDEKVSYMFTYPIIIDVDNNSDINKKVKSVLGKDFERKLKNIAIEASNTGVGWMHYWIDKNNDFKYEKVNSEEIIPKYSNGLEKDLESIIRVYSCKEEKEGVVDEELYTYLEYWTDSTIDIFKFQGGTCCGSFLEEKHIKHELGKVPFIEFDNNSIKHSDLSKYKNQIDLYDKVKSGYANDLEDIQQIIYILENYGGADLAEFKKDLKRYKTIKTETDSAGSSGGVKTLQIEIPVEARKVILDILRKEIYEFGQGLQQDVESVGNASGVALKFFYRKIELKSGLMETEFRSSINKLVEAILKFLEIENYNDISQTYTRNMISNDYENAQIAQMSIGFISNKTIMKNHPWVEDADLEEEQKKKEYKKKNQDNDDYKDAFPNKEEENNNDEDE